MSSPAASWALMIAATASRYCSRNSESPKAALNERPSRLRSNHSGRGYDPVIAVGNTMSRVVFSIAISAGLPVAGIIADWPSRHQTARQLADNGVASITHGQDVQVDKTAFGAGSWKPASPSNGG